MVTNEKENSKNLKNSKMYSRDSDSREIKTRKSFNQPMYKPIYP